MHKKVVEALERGGVPYKVHLHEAMGVVIRNPHDFAQALSYKVDRVTKTLLLRATNEQVYCVAVLSSNKKANLEMLAQLMKAKRLQMASREELSEILDYPPTGVSPIGIENIPVWIDEGLMLFSSILIGSGQAGIEIEISPHLLQEITAGEIVAIVI